MNARARDESRWDWRSTLVLALQGAFLLAISAYSAFALVTGRPTVGRTSNSHARHAYEAYGPGAFAVDSTVYLSFLSIAVAVGVAVAVRSALRGRDDRNRIASGAALGTAALGNVAAIVLDIVYAVRGVPFRNFQLADFADVQPLMYGITMAVPATFLFGIVVVGRLYRRNKVRIF